jgi:N utilization substance protein A
METTIAVPRHELLQIAEAVAREKGIERDEVLEAMEQAVQKAGRSKYGHEHDIRAFIDRKSGEIKLQRFREVADPVENEITQITPADAKRHGHEAKVGEFLIDDLPPIDFGRIAAQTAKQVIVQKVREAERKRQYDEYKGRKGEIVNGLVKRVEFGNVTVDLGKRRGDAAPRRAAAARELPQRRPGARLHRRRPRGAARPADLPVAHPSAVHGQAVRPGGAGDL